MKLNSRLRSALNLSELSVIIIVLALCSIIVAPSLPGRHWRREQRYNHNRKCSNNLKAVGIGLLLYAQDHRFFPHMVSLKEKNGPKDVQRVFESLFYYKFIENADCLVCPASEEEPIELASTVLKDPTLVSLSHSEGVKREHAVEPVLRVNEVAIMDNPHISYTYVKRRLNSNSARADTALCADKDYRKDNDSASEKSARVSRGSHDDGFTQLHADGHTTFMPLAEADRIQRLVSRLVFAGTNAEKDLSESSK